MLILVVDDEEAIRSLIRVILGRSHEVVVAGNAKEAITLYPVDRKVDLVITDMVMPMGCGDEVIAYVKQHHPNVPVCLMSGTHGESEVAADYYLPKPWRPNDLLSLIERVKGNK